MNKLKNWRIDNADDICRLTLDKPGGGQNVLSAEVIGELHTAIAEIERLAPRGLIVCSGKENGFIAGADVTEFTAIQDEAKTDSATAETRAREMIKVAHDALNRLEALPFPTVAMINGHCLGGGMELALACDYRIARDEPSIRLGLPEVMLGIHPGFGGTVRLPETVGVLPAMGLMLSGRTVAPQAARRLGLIDFAVPSRQLETTARYVLDRRPKQRHKTRLRQLQNAALKTRPARTVLANILHKKTNPRANPEHYPAPFNLIVLWRKHGGRRAAMLKAEQASAAQLITTATSRNLVRVFFLREGLRKAPTKTKPHAFNHVHVVGAGVMGGDIAAWCALQGMTATVHDANPDALARATRRAGDLFRRKLKSPRLVQLAMDRFQPDPAAPVGHGACRADVVIEAIVENIAAKTNLFANLQQTARADALLATNTSSIPLENLSAALDAPKRLVGLHFFNPVARMQLVEIVRGQHSDAGEVKRAAAFARRIGRLPVTVNSCPGFLVNRILMPYLLEAVELLAEGRPGSVIDRAATDFGMPMGPVELADTVGLDICLHVAQNLNQSADAVPKILRQKVDAGHLGKKTGRGFYKWRDGKPDKKQSGKGGARIRVIATIQDRLILRFLNEAVACLHDGVVQHPDHLDAALIFGAGFAPFRGGPMHYIFDHGRDTIARKLGAFHEQYGDRFQPGPGWKKLAAE